VYYIIKKDFQAPQRLWTTSFRLSLWFSIWLWHP